MHPFLVALQFLTRLPVRVRREITPEDQGLSLVFYPLAGLLIGVILYALSAILGGQDDLLQAALLLLA